MPTPFTKPVDPLFPPSDSVKGMRLEVSPNGRYLVTAEGRPFFYLGDTAWELFKRLNHEEVDVYFKNRIAKGFTVIQAYMLRGLKSHNLYGDLTLVDGDPARPNEAFFENTDYIINRANELGLVMGIVTNSGQHVRKGSLDEQVFTESNAFAFGKFMGSRYRQNAVIWFMGGDRTPDGHEAIWTAMAGGLKEGSAGDHLVSYHGPGPAPGVINYSSSFWFHDADWLDFNAIQSSHAWGTLNYEFNTHDYAYSFGDPEASMNWGEAIDCEGAFGMGYMRRLLELRPWYRMVPDRRIVASVPGILEDHVQAARAEDGSFVLAYSPFGNPFSVRMDKISGAKVMAHWYDPRTGVWQPIGEYANTGVQEFVAPSCGEKDDWVLVLDDAAKGLSP